MYALIGIKVVLVVIYVILRSILRFIWNPLRSTCFAWAVFTGSTPFKTASFYFLTILDHELEKVNKFLGWIKKAWSGEGEEDLPF